MYLVKRILRRIRAISKITLLLIMMATIWLIVGILAAVCPHLVWTLLFLLASTGLIVLFAIQLDTFGSKLTKVEQHLQSLEGKIAEASTQNTDRSFFPVHLTSQTERARALNEIEAYQPPVLDTTAKGRQAAAVQPDPLRPYKLHRAITGSSTLDDNSRQSSANRVAIIGGRDIIEQLEQQLPEAQVITLNPGAAAAQLDVSRPQSLVIHEANIDEGLWATALDPEGTALLAQLLDTLAVANQCRVHTYLIPASATHISTTSLASQVDTVVVDPSTPMLGLETEAIRFLIETE